MKGRPVASPFPTARPVKLPAGLAVVRSAPPKPARSELASRLGTQVRALRIDRSYTGGIERGEHDLALVSLLKFIAALGMQPSEFFKDLDRPKRKKPPAAS